MRHPTDGALRRLLDEPAAVADTDREHVVGCPVCRSGLAVALDDASATRAALDAALDVEHAVDVDAGWQRLSRAVTADGRRRAAAVAPARRRRPALRGPVVAVVGVVALLTGAGAAAAADWLEIFRTERVAPLTLTQSDVAALPDLSAYGEVEVTEQSDLRNVEDPAAAEEAIGLPVPEPAALPRGVVGEPEVQIGDRVSAEFTFSAEEAARTSGGAAPPPPPGLDGSRFRLVAGPGLAAVWSSESGLPALVVARAVAPSAYSSGVPFGTARDYLLSLPGLPEDAAGALRGFADDGTLPLPVPAGLVTSSATDVRGTPATVLTSRDSAMTGVVWVEGGVVTVVAGSLTTDEVLSVARGLRR